MSQASFSNDVVKVFVNKEVGSVIVEWTTSPTSKEYRDGLEKGLEVLTKHKLKNWIGDVRKLGAIGEDDQKWSNEVWFPGALKAGISKMAVIVADDIFNLLSVEEIMNQVDSDGFVSHFFSNKEEALDWVK